MHVALKVVILSMGMVWSAKGRQSSRLASVALICAPHCSFYDAVTLVLCDDIPYAVSRAENANMPIIGSMWRGMNVELLYHWDHWDTLTLSDITCSLPQSVPSVTCVA